MRSDSEHEGTEHEETAKNNLILQSAQSTATVASLKSKKIAHSVVVRTISFGLNGVFLASYMAGSGKLLAMLGANDAGGAAALINPFQSAILGIAVGPILAMGLEMSRAAGKNEYIRAGNIIKTGWVAIAGLGTVGSVVMVLTRPIFPHIFASGTSQAAASFFSGCSIGNIPLLMLISDGLVAFEEGDWYVPAAIGALIFSSSLSCSYVLAFPAKLGAFGIGLGSSVGPLLVCGLMRVWFTREYYKKYELYNLSSIPDFRQTMMTILSLGWQLTIQRLTEWVNLFGITTVIGLESDDALRATGPAMQFVGVMAGAMQGIAAITGMLIARNNGARQIELQRCDAVDTSVSAHDPLDISSDQPIVHMESRQTVLELWNKKNISTIIYCGVVAFGLTGVFCIPAYFARQPLTSFLLAPTINSTTPANSTLVTNPIAETNFNVSTLAETLLWVNIIGLFPDAARIVLMGALRGWKDILLPTMISFIAMIIIGIPVGWLVGDKFEQNSYDGSKSAWMFYTRAITMSLAIFLIGYRCAKQLSNDIKPSPTPSTSSDSIVSGGYCCFFRSKPRIDMQSAPTGREERTRLLSHPQINVMQ